MTECDVCGKEEYMKGEITEAYEDGPLMCPECYECYEWECDHGYYFAAS